jgi:hypothetical protein
MTATLYFAAAALISWSTFSYTQNVAAPTDSQTLRQRDAEDQVAKILDTERVSLKLKPLKRVRPTDFELQMTCTAALTNNTDIEHSGLASFQVYKTTDFEQTSDILYFIASGRRKDWGESERAVFTNADSQYSTIVFRDPRGSTEKPVWFVGVSRHESNTKTWFGCIANEFTLNDSCWGYKQYLKDIVAPACAGLKAKG